MAKDELTVLEGNLSAAGLKIAVVCARFNEFFVSKLFSGAVDAIIRHGGSRKNITQAWGLCRLYNQQHTTPKSSYSILQYVFS